MKKIYLWISFVFAYCTLYSQSMSVIGKVMDESGDNLSGVTVVEKGTSNGGITNILGTFELSVDSSATLVVSFIGFTTQEVLVERKKTIQIYLREEVGQLDEVVVTALGIERQTQGLGYSVQSINSTKISQVKSANFVNNLAGKLAGVTVTQGATGVGSSSKITIRGEASFTNNNPLFIVDGIPINNNSIINLTNDAASGFQEIDFGNGAMGVNSDDVEDVSILKGPGAAALYGTRASNGVIIIRTKDGSNSRGLGISINSTTMIDRPFQLPRFQNEYGQGNSGQFEFVDGLGGGTNDNISYSWGPRLNQGTTIPQYDSPVLLPDGSVVRGGDVAAHGGLPITPTPFVAYPSNLKDFYQTGITTINNISFSNRFSQGSYRVSFTDFRNKSIIPGVNLDRKTLATRLLFRPVEQLKITSSISYTNSQSANRPSGGYGSENINYSLVAWGPRSLNIAAMRSYWQPGLENIQQYSFNYTFFDNPYFILLENRNSFNRDRVIGNLAATYYFNDKFSLAIRSGMDYSSEKRQFRRAFSTNRFRNGGYAVHDVFFREINTDFLFNFNENFEKMTLDISLGGNSMEQQASTVQQQVLSLAQPSIFRLTNGASPVEVVDFLSEKRINSLYGIAKFNYGEFLFIEATARNDWSSALATPTSTENVSFFYPSVALSFVASNLIKMPKKIDFLKFRASWAQVGNDTNPYQTSGVFQASTPYNNQPTFGNQSTIPNMNLLPEKTSVIELGGELRFFNNRFFLDVSYYNSVTKNQIIMLPVSITSGYRNRIVNGGKVRSQGIEIIVGFTAIKRQLLWDIDLNFSRNVTRIESLPDEVNRLTLEYSSIYDNENQTVFFQVEEGGKIGDIYGTGYKKTANGEFIVGENGLYSSDNNLIKLGNYNPDFILGMSHTIHYKNWQLDLLFDWRKGGIVVSRTLALAAVGGQLEETDYRPEEGVIAPGVVRTGGTDVAPTYEPNSQLVTAEAFYRNFHDRNHEENNIYSASYLKLREASISYSFNKGFFNKNKTLDISLIGRNLFAFSEIPHFDPEQLAVQGQQFVSGVEDLSYPSTRSIGIKLSFEF